jgi:hypothetical protein
MLTVKKIGPRLKIIFEIFKEHYIRIFSSYKDSNRVGIVGSSGGIGGRRRRIEEAGQWIPARINTTIFLVQVHPKIIRRPGDSRRGVS